ncbi:MAG: shikimate kinase [Candidatus Helarchaeota archaeon]
MTKTNIALIGFMGTGKSTIGKHVAEKLNKNFIEMDDYIVKMAGKSIPSIFKENGEIIFREFEIRACKELSKLKNTVISCGGGIILNKINLDYLNLSSIIICLNATPEIIYKRTMKDGKEKRPLLANPNPMKSIKDLLDYRKPLYDRATKYQIDTDGLTIEKCTEKIIEIYENEISCES